MPKLKLLISLSLVLAVFITQVGAVRAAHQQDVSLITGTIQDVMVETNPESGSQIVVIILLMNDKTQTVRISIETAFGLGLIVLDENGNQAVDDSMFGSILEIDPAVTIPTETSAPEEKQHPVGAKISEFFSNIFGVDYELVMSARSNSFGFGVISQSLWITQKLGGDATLFQTILDAKKNHDYSEIALPFGAIPQNWGQFKKAVLHGEDDKNFGGVVSGSNGTRHETPLGQAKDKDGNGNNSVTPPGLGKDKDNNEKAGDPPGQNKDKNNNGNGNIK